jgi:hypothetical protein
MSASIAVVAKYAELTAERQLDICSMRLVS